MLAGISVPGFRLAAFLINFCQCVLSDSSSSVLLWVTACTVGKTTKSKACSVSCPPIFIRKLSRTSRLIRLRPTALGQTFLDTAMPRRWRETLLGCASMRKQLSPDRTGCLKTRLYSAGLSSRDSLVNFCLITGLELSYSGR